MQKNIKKVPVIQINKIGGLKCDNPYCCSSDMTIKVEDYKEYIDYKCPLCGQSVLTRKDYIAFKFFIKLIALINFIFPKRIPDKNEDIIATCEFNGTGEISSKVKKEKVNNRIKIIPNKNICAQKKLTPNTEYEVIEIDYDISTPDEYYKIKNDDGEEVWIDDWDCKEIKE